MPMKPSAVRSRTVSSGASSGPSATSKTRKPRSASVWARSASAARAPASSGGLPPASARTRTQLGSSASGAPLTHSRPGTRTAWNAQIGSKGDSASRGPPSRSPGPPPPPPPPRRHPWGAPMGAGACRSGAGQRRRRQHLARPLGERAGQLGLLPARAWATSVSARCPGSACRSYPCRRHPRGPAPPRRKPAHQRIAVRQPLGDARLADARRIESPSGFEASAMVAPVPMAGSGWRVRKKPAPVTSAPPASAMAGDLLQRLTQPRIQRADGRRPSRPARRRSPPCACPGPPRRPQLCPSPS